MKNNNYLSIYRKSGLVTLLICLFSFQFVCLAQSSRLGGTTGIGEVTDSQKTDSVKKVLSIQQISAGMRLPDTFWDTKFQIFHKGDVLDMDLREYRGKPLLLSFWSSTCGMCLYNFPKLKNFRDKYDDSLNILLVNSKKTRDSYERISKVMLKDNFSYHLASLIEDDFMSAMFPHGPIPHYIWISAKGRIAAITDHTFVTESNVLTLLIDNKND